MLKSCFFASGLFVMLCGVSLLFIDKLVLNAAATGENEGVISAMISTVAPESRKTIDPPDWAAFSMMSIGTVTMLYAVALPKRNG